MRSLFVVMTLWPALLAATGFAASGDGRDLRAAEGSFQKFEVAGIRMNVPVDYLQEIEQPVDDRVRTLSTAGRMILFHGIAPDMGPPPFDYRKNWKGGNGFPQYVRFSLEVTRPDLREAYFTSRMRKLLEDGICAAKNVGDACRSPHEAYYADDFEALYTGRGHEFVICDKIDDFWRARCKFRVILYDRVIVSVSFDRRVLNFQKPIWDQTLNLICTWIDIPAVQTSTTNRCRKPAPH